MSGFLCPVNPMNRTLPAFFASRAASIVPPVDFGHQECTLAIAMLERLTHATFALAAVVVPAVIEESDSVIDCGTNDADTLSLLEVRFAKMISPEPYCGNLLPRAAERAAGNFPLGFRRRRVRREARKDRGPNGSLQELSASDR